MTRVVFGSVWSEIKKLKHSSPKGLAAVAYLSDAHLLPMRAADVVIVDASDGAIKCGQTSARALRHLAKKNVVLYSQPGLHAKVFLIGGVAVIGSANASKSSASLIEAVVISDLPSVVGTVRRRIKDLTNGKWGARELKDADIQRLLKLPVSKGFAPRPVVAKEKVQTGYPKTWLIGVQTRGDSEFPLEGARAEAGATKAKARLRRRNSAISDIRYTKRSRTGHSMNEDDWVIQIWRDSPKAPAKWVERHQQVVRKQSEPTCTRFYVEEPADTEKWQLSFAQFKRLLKQVGVNWTPSRDSERLLDPEISDVLFELWPKKT